MSLQQTLENVAYALDTERGIGKTSHITDTARVLGAQVICADARQSKRIADEFKVPATPMHAELRGLRGPFVIDHHAASTLMQLAAEEIASLTEENAQLREAAEIRSATTEGYRDKIKEIVNERDALAAKLEALQKENESLREDAERYKDLCR